MLQEEGVVGAISKPITSLITGGLKKGRVERVTAAKLPIILHFPHFLGKGRVLGGMLLFSWQQKIHLTGVSWGIRRGDSFLEIGHQRWIHSIPSGYEKKTTGRGANSRSGKHKNAPGKRKGWGCARYGKMEAVVASLFFHG